MPHIAQSNSAVPGLGLNPAAAESAELPSAAQTSMGLVTYCFELAKRNRAYVSGLPDFTDPLDFIQEAARLGTSAVQIPFGVREGEYIKHLRETAERLGIALETTISLPRGENDSDRFETEVRTARELGVEIVRTVLLPGRRYEQFKTLEDYQGALQRGLKSLRIALQIARRAKVKLALENHKDQHTEERLRLLQEFSSENLGCCFDVGNNIALLEEPVETARAFAPWTLTVHFKDQALREYEDGFLLADIAAGRGAIDLQQVVQIIREKKPGVRFHLELITRDALRVPFLQDEYWATLGELKAKQLAASLAVLRSHSSAVPFPLVSSLPPAEQVALERRNIEQSLAFSREKLGFTI